MKSMQIQNGDLFLSTSNRVGFVYGRDKLIQDLRLWLMEPIGIGMSTPTFGSILQDLVGVANAQEQKVKITAEIQRILGLYQAKQLEDLRQAKLSNMLTIYTKQEILNSVNNIQTVINQDRVIVQIFMSTLSNPSNVNSNTAINVTIGPTGIVVS